VKNDENIETEKPGFFSTSLPTAKKKLSKYN